MKTKATKQFINVSMAYFLIIGIYAVTKIQSKNLSSSQVKVDTSHLIAGSK